MLIGIISDLHLGHRHASIEQYKNILLKLQENVDIIVDCGDLLDNNFVTSIQATQLYNIFKNVDKPTFILRGNHDTLENTTALTMLNLNKNVTIINDIQQIQLDNGLVLGFVPYTKNFLDNLNFRRKSDIIFSHINVTYNKYAEINLEDASKLKQLFTLSPIWFNGHIHTPELCDNLFGKFINIGSCSSLTFSDEHIPCYLIYNTDNDNYQYFVIDNTVIHKTCNFDDNFDNLNNINQKICWRINLPLNTSFELRQNILDKLKHFDNTVEVKFNFMNNVAIKTTEEENNKQIKEQDNKQLMQKLISDFEAETNIKITEDIMGKLHD